MTSKRATIYDIAEKTNLTANTVSRVLNNKGYISKKTRVLVEEAAKELNYVPNDIARSLKSSETKQILLAVPYVKEVFNLDLIAAVQSVIQEKDYFLILMYTESDEKKELRAIESVMRNHADGLILTTINLTDTIIDKVRTIGKPCVVNCFNKPREDQKDLPFDFVCVDTKKGIYAATKHLIEQGHTDISYVGTKRSIAEGVERYAGFAQAMKEANLPIHKDYIFTGDSTELLGYESGKKIATLKKRPTAVCAGTDAIVIGLYRAFEQENIIISEEISIVGMDNIDLCTLVKPKISSVSVSQAQVGLTCANIIFERLAEQKKVPYHNIAFDPELIIRESSLRKM